MGFKEDMAWSAKSLLCPADKLPACAVLAVFARLAIRDTGEGR